ncbi:hypothetical protein [Sphingobacterium siyangense]|uniref:hypothetical protein n=1 Tax=Sphingobacterium siyangense TaxID=459529 RepID=UPI0019656EDF|nr:hypothetical protein [Sphingobacterium siyangense]QRY57277.1 hypothetical protein JVX97_25335 [Sphingobacterium siyangense]
MNPKNFNIRYLYSLFMLILPWTSCDDKDKFDFNQHNKVAVTTLQMTGVTKNDATLNGRVNTNNGETLTQVGICYATHQKPTVNNEKVLKTGDLDTGAFTLYAQNLKPATTYYFRAFATNKNGTAYGDPLSFTTQSGYVAKLETQSASSITRITAELGGKISDDGGYPVISKGVCYSNVSSFPTISNDKVSIDTQSTSFKVNLSKLKAGTVYYARAYATSSVGTGYGQVVNFTTLPPIVASGITTATVSSVTYSSASVGGTVLDDNGSTVTARGICYSNSNTTPSISSGTVLNIGSGTGSFSGQLTGLTVNTSYYVRAFATNSAGTSYGPVVGFKTLMPELPSSVLTTVPYAITKTSAYTGGSIGSAGGGTISAKGVVYSSSNSLPSLTNGTTVSGGSGSGSFSLMLSGLQYNTTYYVRSYATNEAGTSYGSVSTFKTLLPSLPSSLSTYDAVSITPVSAYVSGYIGFAGEGIISASGIVYSSSTSNPTIGNSTSVTLGGSIGSIATILTGLSAGTNYYARVYATNEAGTAYGNLISFTTTRLTAPTGVTTYQVGSIGSTYVTFSGDIATDGGSALTERGFVYSTSSNPTLSSGTKTTVSGSSVGYFNKSVTGFNRNTTYYVRAYATNAYGTTYGSSYAFYYY